MLSDTNQRLKEQNEELRVKNNARGEHDRSQQHQCTSTQHIVDEPLFVATWTIDQQNLEKLATQLDCSNITVGMFLAEITGTNEHDIVQLQGYRFWCESASRNNWRTWYYVCYIYTKIRSPHPMR